MKIKFQKFHGTGNDFIIIDNRDLQISLSQDQIAHMCHRNFGIGADGLMYLLPSENGDFEMKYFNADGNEGSMCGNGGRCIAAYAFDTGYAGKDLKFSAIDGFHEANVERNSESDFKVKISLSEVSDIQKKTKDIYILNTGSPHYVEFVEKNEKEESFEKGKNIRWSKEFQPNGINVNFVEQTIEELIVQTFERGVENLTLSCGTGVTAAAIAASEKLGGKIKNLNINTLGGNLRVSLEKSGNKYTNIYLEGPVKKVFEGTINL